MSISLCLQPIPPPALVADNQRSPAPQKANSGGGSQAAAGSPFVTEQCIINPREMPRLIPQTTTPAQSIPNHSLRQIVLEEATFEDMNSERRGDARGQPLPKNRNPCGECSQAQVGVGVLETSSIPNITNARVVVTTSSV